MKWDTICLGELVTEMSVRNKANLDYPVFSVTNKDGFTPSEEYFKKQVFSKKLNNYKVVSCGAFAYNPSRVNVGSIDYLCEEKNVLVSPLYVVFQSDHSLLNSYLKRFLKSEWGNQQIRNNTQGAVRDSLKFSGLKSIQIPLPPLEEQKRIAGILDAADALRAKRRQSLEDLDTLLQSTFLDMFGDPVTNPMGWELDQLANSVTVQGGFAFKSKDYCERGIRIVKISNVHSGNLKWEETNYVPEKYLELYKDYALECGDLVIALTRPIIKSLNSVKIATVGAMDAPSLLNQRVARFVFPTNASIEKSYLLAYCHTPFFKNAVQKFCSESLQPNMSTKQLGSILIAHPPVSLQQRFAGIVESIEKQKALYQSQFAELDTLFASLQQRAFNGEL